MEVAETILRQLGGGMFRAMTGARNFLVAGDGLQFDLGRGAKVSRVRVTLDPDDTYTLTGYRGRGLSIREVARVSGLYADQLRDVFTDMTGFYTSL